MSFVFASLVELALIGFLMRKEGRTTIKLKSIGRKKKVSMPRGPLINFATSPQRKTDAIRQCERLDLKARFCFPGMVCANFSLRIFLSSRLHGVQRGLLGLLHAYREEFLTAAACAKKLPKLCLGDAFISHLCAVNS